MVRILVLTMIPHSILLYKRGFFTVAVECTKRDTRLSDKSLFLSIILCMCCPQKIGDFCLETVATIQKSLNFYIFSVSVYQKPKLTGGKKRHLQSVLWYMLCTQQQREYSTYDIYTLCVYDSSIFGGFQNYEKRKT